MNHVQFHDNYLLIRIAYQYKSLYVYQHTYTYKRAWVKVILSEIIWTRSKEPDYDLMLLYYQVIPTKLLLVEVYSNN